MISIRPFHEYDAEVLHQFYAPEMSEDEILDMIHEWEIGIYKGKLFEMFAILNGQNIIGYYVEDDGLETVKNQGRQDIKDKWQDFEDYWVKAIHDGVDDRFNTRQVIDPREHLSYQMPQKPFEVFEEDFIKTLTDYEMYHRGIDPKQFNEAILSNVLYNSEVTQEDDTLNIKISV